MITEDSIKRVRELISKKRSKRKLVKPLLEPIYDDVYYQGMRWLDWLAMSESKPICIHFYNDSSTCESSNCVCDLYEPEQEQGIE